LVASLRQTENEVAQLSKSDRVRYDTVVKWATQRETLNNRLADLDVDIQNIPVSLERDMQICVDFLSRRGYILTDGATTLQITDLRKSHLTTKGIFANYLNQCHEIMITEAMLTRKLADAFMHDPSNLAAWLAVYIDENCAKEDALTGATDLGLDAVACGEEVHDELVRIGLSDGAGEFKLSTKYVDPVWEWCQGAHLQTVCQTYDIFEGNMVRALQKLINLIDELKAAFDAINGVEWANALETTKTLIRRDVLQVDSIYLTS
jgi:superfamily II RNA helicase